MKRIVNYLRFITVSFVLALMSVPAIAQEGGGAEIDVNVSKDGGNWYAQPWVWIVGGAVFILLLVALLRSGGERRE